MNIKQSIFDRRCAKVTPRLSAYPSYDHVRSVFVLFESEWQERNADIKKLVARLQNDGKKVVAWGYCPKKDILSPILPEHRILGTSSVNLFGGVKKIVLQDLSRMQFDLLLDLTLNPVLPLQYVALYARADFKIGCRLNERLYNMTVPASPNTTPEYMFGQMIHYLQTIKSAD